MAKRRIKSSSRQLELDFERHENLPGLKHSGDAEALMSYAASLDPGYLVGKVPLKKKMERLMSGLEKKESERALKQMQKSRGKPEEFSLIVETLDYALLRGRFTQSEKTIEGQRKDGELSAKMMRAYLEIGEVYESDNMGLTQQRYGFEKEWLSGGTGLGKSVKVKGDIQFPPGKEGLVLALEKMGVEAVTVRGGKSVKPSKAGKGQLMAIYARKVKEDRAEKRRRERLLDQI